MLTGAAVYLGSGGGVTVGAHRYYTHRAFKATFGLQCWLIGLFTIAGQVRTGNRIPGLVAAVM
jgi:fatty-acid desaturase